MFRKDISVFLITKPNALTTKMFPSKNKASFSPLSHLIGMCGNEIMQVQDLN